LNELIRQFMDIVASRFFRNAPNGNGGFAGELTRLNCEGQFKPFVYLNGRGSRTGVNTGIATRLVGKERPDGGPFKVRELIPHDSRPGLNA
jgi:hypothetical protein